MSDTQARADRKHRYERVLRTVEYQTGGPESIQTAGVSQSTVVMLLVAQSHHERSGVMKALRAGVENGDLFRWTTTPERDTRWDVKYARTTDAALRAVVAEQNARDEPNTEVIEAAAALL
ncbi:MAG: hypothetical protein ACNS61_02290 [Candidatus Wenzhouxiangella sp. M2_3B_020]